MEQQNIHLSFKEILIKKIYKVRDSRSYLFIFFVGQTKVSLIRLCTNPSKDHFV